MNWDLQANVSLRKSPQEQFKKLVRNKGQKAVGQKHSRLLEGWRVSLSRLGSFPPATVCLPQITFHLQSRKKQSTKKMARLNLSPSYVLQTVAPCLPPFYLKHSLCPEPLCLETKVVLEKMLFKGVTFHLGTLQSLDPLVWGKQPGLCQGDYLLWEMGPKSWLQDHSSLERKLGLDPGSQLALQKELG